MGIDLNQGFVIVQIILTGTEKAHEQGLSIEKKNPKNSSFRAFLDQASWPRACSKAHQASHLWTQASKGLLITHCLYSLSLFIGPDF